jgi:hypothetical protein
MRARIGFGVMTIQADGVDDRLVFCRSIDCSLYSIV